MTVQDILKSTETLSTKDRAYLAHQLIASLDDKDDDGADAAWAELADTRYQELVSGTVQASTLEEFNKSLSL